MTPAPTEAPVDLSGRFVLVTGASRGLGRAVVRAVAGAGARTIVTARTRGALEELDDELRGEGASLTLLPLDLCDGDAVERIGPSIHARFGRLALVHCAAQLGTLTPTQQLDPMVLESTVRLGAFATQRLIRTTDPLLRAAPAGTAVFVDDPFAGIGRPFAAAYTAAKAAQRAIVEAWAAENRRTSMRIHLFAAEPMRTRLRRAAFPGEASDARPEPEAMAGTIMRLLV